MPEQRLDDLMNEQDEIHEQELAFEYYEYIEMLKREAKHYPQEVAK